MDMNDLLTRIIKYVVEGVAVALALVFIPRKHLPLDEVLTVTILAAAVFTVLSDTAIERATRREAVRQLRMCCNCGHALPNDPPKIFDNCTPCTHCGRAWKHAEAP